MADVGLGQRITTTGRRRSRVLKDAVKDNHPVYTTIDEQGGIKRYDGGRTIVEEAKSGQNGSTTWVGESGVVPVQDYKVLDAAEANWSYQLAIVMFSLAEQYMNSGGSDTKIIDLVAGKYSVAEDSMMNEFHGAMLSSGTGDGGLQMPGLATLVSTTPTSGVVMGIDRSNANAAWFRNQKFDTAGDWADGAVDAGNVKRFLDKGINATTRGSKSMIDCFLLGNTHFEFLTQAIQAIQNINDNSGTGKAGFQRMIYRGIPSYLSGGINYSGEAAQTATRTYGLCTKPGGVNLVFHEKAEFDLLEPIQANDQAAISRLLFTMSAMTIGGLAKFNWVGFD